MPAAVLTQTLVELVVVTGFVSILKRTAQTQENKRTHQVIPDANGSTVL